MRTLNPWRVGHIYSIKLDTRAQRTSSVRMGYLLVVLAVVLVPVVAQNQSHVPSITTTCPAAVDQVSSRVDQLISGLLVLNKQVYQIQTRFN